MLEKQDKYKILTIIRNPLGGIRTYIKYTYGKLDSKKYQFTILAATEDEEDSQHIERDLLGFDADIIKVRGKNLELLLLYNIIKIIREKKINVIHSQGFTAAVLAVLGNYFSRTHHIVTFHEVLTHDQFSSLKGIIKRKILAILLGRADIIQTVSQDALNNLIDFVPNLSKKKEKLVVIKNGISVDSFVKIDNNITCSLHKKIGVRNGCFLFGFLGRFMPEKGFDFLIEAVNELSQDVEFSGAFKILAVNNGDYIREYKKIIRKRNLSGYFIFYGFVPEVNRIINELDAVVIPSVREAGPLLPMEAFVLGCPVIATDCVGLREVVDGTPAMVIKSKDSHSIVKAIRTFMKNPISFKEKAVQFIPEAKKRFNVQNTAEQLDAVFNEVISSKRD